MSELLFLQPNKLKIHPKNVRIYYPPKDVAEMARSLAAVGKSQPAGNIQALLVTPVEGEDYYWVIDGNLRLNAARELGDECPPLKCEIVEGSQAEQLLLMAATGLHYPKDPISEGRHYRRLIEEEGYTIALIAASTGLSASTIGSRLAALDLDEEIQHLMMRKELPADVRIIRALRQVPDTEKRLSIARYYAGRDVAIGSMVQRIRSLIERIHHVDGSVADYREAQARWKAQTQAATASRLANCEGLDSAARAVIARLAGEFLCEGCRIEGLSAPCYLCPGPQEFIEHLVELAETGQDSAADTAGEAWQQKVKSVEEVRRFGQRMNGGGK